MSGLDKLTSNLRDTVDHLAEGWQEFWHKARAAITRFTPGEEVPVHSSRWGVLSADMRESGDHIEILLEVPGMDADDFDIQVDRGALRIRGSKQHATDRTEGRYHITERAYGRFERVIALPCPVDEDSASADYRRGVLEISLTKHHAERPRRIVVRG